MKKTLLIISMLIFIPHTVMYAQDEATIDSSNLFSKLKMMIQDDTAKRHTVKLSTVALVRGTTCASYEFRLTPHMSTEVSLGANLLQPWYKTGTIFTAVSQLHMRFYFIEQRDKGFMPFIGAGMNYSYASVRLDEFDGNNGWDISTRRVKLTDTHTSPTFILGIKNNFACSLSIEALIGFQFVLVDNDLLDNTIMPTYFGTLMTIKIGWLL